MKRHLFVCTNPRGSGRPACGARGSDELLAAVQTELIRRGEMDARVTSSGCLGPCFDGPNAVVYPEGVWYANLTVADAARLADHLSDGTILADRRAPPPGCDGE